MDLVDVLTGSTVVVSIVMRETIVTREMDVIDRIAYLLDRRNTNCATSKAAREQAVEVAAYN